MLNTPHDRSDSTPDSASDSTSDSAPDSTPDSTSDSTPDCGPAEEPSTTGGDQRSTPPGDEPPTVVSDEPVKQDATTKEILLYAVANIENAFCNLFPNALTQVLIIAFLVDPLLTGLVLALKVLFDAVTDPIMAYISDNARTRFGRRRPFILVGATGRMLAVVALFALFPAVDYMLSNEDLAQKDRDEVARQSAQAVGEVEGAREPTALQDSEAAAVAVPVESPPGENETEATPDDEVDSEPDERSWVDLMFGKLVNGIQAFYDEENAEQRSLVVYVLVFLLIFTLFSTVVGTPYYAMGIELCSSYEGRTKLVVYRSVIDKILAFLNPWIVSFVFWTVWSSAVQGFLVVSIVFAILGIASTWIMVFNVKEPARSVKAMEWQHKNRIGFFKSLWITMKNVHFLRVFSLYQIIGVGQGVFLQFNIFLNIYWVAASAQKGSIFFALAGTVGNLCALIALPVMKSVADRFEKHRAIALGVALMAIGSLANWWLLTPENPYLQLITPLFFAFGISGFYSIMGAMVADVTDVDELHTGQRREGMFSAVMSLLGKMVSTVVPVLGAVALTVSGFDPANGFEQVPGTFTRMRIMYCSGPLVCYLFGLVVALTYPLTRERMGEIQAELKQRRAAAFGEADSA